MRINELRRELNTLLAGTAFRRPPALRRSLSEDWLYAADLPGICSGPALEDLLSRVREAGWETGTEGDWIQFRKPAPEPPEGWYEGPFGAEAACCAGLLRRHPERESAPPCRETCLLIKAGEEGREALERACADLHGQWAERLRTGRKLPAISGKYFGEQ